jgi:hypothetical protein
MTNNNKAKRKVETQAGDAAKHQCTVSGQKMQSSPASSEGETPLNEEPVTPTPQQAFNNLPMEITLPMNKNPFTAPPRVTQGATGKK